jgi:hypothetical protein
VLHNRSVIVLSVDLVSTFSERGLGGGGMVVFDPPGRLGGVMDRGGSWVIVLDGPGEVCEVLDGFVWGRRIAQLRCYWPTFSIRRSEKLEGN